MLLRLRLRRMSYSHLPTPLTLRRNFSRHGFLPYRPRRGLLLLGNLCSSLNKSFRRSLSHTSVQSDGTFYSPTDQAPVLHHSPILGWRFGREGPFVATNPQPRIGGDIGGCAYRCTTYRDFASPLAGGQWALLFRPP